MGCGSSKIGVSKVNVQPIEESKQNATPESLEKRSDSLIALDLGSSNKLLTSASFRSRKNDLLSIVDNDFNEVDERSSFVSSDIRTNAKEIVEYLVQPYETALLKLRAIWIWVTHNINYNVDTFFNPEEKTSSQGDASDVLNTGKAICSGYSNLMKYLAELVGIRMERVDGWSKGYNYVTGMKFTGSNPNHSWNAVLLHDDWWLLDSTWGAGYVDENKNFIRQYSEHYFLTDPKEFIYDHFPTDKNWQLLPKLIPIETFESYARLTKNFFKLKMQPYSHKEGVVSCDTGKLHLKFRIDKEIPVKCTGKLIENKNNISEEETFIHVYSSEKTLHVLVDVPYKGDFELKLFGRQMEVTNKELPLIASYLIKCTGKLGKASTFPKQFRKWNPGFYLHSPTQGVLNTEQKYKFKITLPHVTDMAICLGGKNSTWERIQNIDGALWEGEIWLPDWVERVNVVARFKGQNKNSPFSSVLEYKVIDKDSL